MGRASEILSRDVRADAEELRPLRRQLRTALVEAASASPADADALVLAASEACANVVNHAYPDGTCGTCHVSLTRAADEVHLVVEDDGPGFEPGTPFEEHVRDESGRGLMMMQALVDRLELGQSDGGGTRIELVKRVRPA